jgi:hypothetical protein
LRQSLDTIGAVLGPLAAVVLMLVLADSFTKRKPSIAFRWPLRSGANATPADIFNTVAL